GITGVKALISSGGAGLSCPLGECATLDAILLGVSGAAVLDEWEEVWLLRL
ncbi:MAG: hypothetical protein Q9224_002471, partial [Gallowayella concinna]